MYLRHFSHSHPVLANNKLLAVMLLSAGLILLSACSGELTPDEYLARALSQHQRGENNAAIIDLKSALQQAPNHAEARRLLGSIYLQLGAVADAEKELHQALDLGIAPEAIAIDLARSLLAQGKYQELLDSTAGLTPTPPTAQANLLALRGHAQLGKGERDTAEKLYDKSLLIDPLNDLAGAGKAQIFLMQESYTEARQYLDVVLKRTPDFAYAWSVLGFLESVEKNPEAVENAYLNAARDPLYTYKSEQQLALLYISEKQFDKAAKVIGSLRKRAKNNPMIDYIEGLSMFNQKRFKEALLLFNAVLGKTPDNLPALYYGGATNLYLGNYVTAQAQLRSHLTSNPTNIAAQKLLAQTELALGNPEAAERLILPVFDQDPGDAAALDLLASVSLRLGNQDAALKYLKEIVSRQPESAKPRLRFGAELARQGKVEQSIIELEQAYKLNPKDNKVTEMLIRQNLQLGKTEQALSLAQNHIDQSPEEAMPYALIGLVHLSSNNQTAAYEAFQRAISIDPDTTSAYNGLALLAIKDKDYVAAEQYYRGALKRDPQDYQTVMNLVNLKKMEGDPIALRAFLEEAVAANPRAVELRLLLSRVYLDIDDADKAIATLEGVDSPNITQKKNLLGLRVEAQLATNRYTEAEISLKELIQLEPEDARIYFYLARAQRGLGELSNMRKSINKATQLDPNYIPAKLALVRIALDDQQIDTAEHLLAELKTKVSADNPAFILSKARLAELKNDFAGATAAYQRLFDLNQNGTNLLRLTQAQWRNGKQNLALEKLITWANKHPAHTHVQHGLAQRYMALQRIPEAVAVYESILKTEADDALALNNLAALLADSDPQTALNYAQRVYTLMPQDPAVMDTLASALLAVEDFPGAERMVNRALAKQPQNSDYLYRQAQVYAAKGQLDLAAKVLSEILQPNTQFSQRIKAEALREQLQE